MRVNIHGEHFSPKGKTCHSYSFPLHLNLRNFLTRALMGTWRKASLRSNPAHMEPCWNHFLTDLISSIEKCTGLTYLLNFFRFRIGLHLSGDLLDLGTAKYELTYCPRTGPTSLIAPFSRSPMTSVLSTSAAFEEMAGFLGVILCRGTFPSQMGL